MFKESSFVPFSKCIYLSTPTMHGDELTYIKQAYDTNWMSSIGENIDVIEDDISKLIGCKYAVGLASATAAMHLAAIVTGIDEHAVVACSDMTFSATINPMRYQNARIILVDSERDTWNMDPEALRKAFSLHPEITHVVVANLYGTPAKLTEIKTVCDEHGAILIEDAAESFGATYDGRMTGTFGLVNAISFNGNKIITGSAGGMLLTDDEELAKHARKLSTQARDAAAWYQHSEVGYNYRISNVVAGVIRGQLPYLSEHIAQKKEIYERYAEGFADMAISMNPYDADRSKPNYWLSCILLDESIMCEQTRTDMTASYVPVHGKSCPTEILETLKKYKVEGRPIWKPMHLQPIYADCDFVSIEGDVGADIFRRGLCLPSDNKLTAEDQNKIIEIVRACFE